MKTKLLCTPVFYFLFSISLIAQDPNFKLSDYRLPDFDFRSLDMDFDLGTNNNSSKRTNTPLQSEAILNNFNVEAELEYARFKNSKIWQKTTDINSGFSFLFKDNYNSNPNIETTYSSFSFFSISQTNRKYVQPTVFREINLKFNTSFSFKRIRNSDNITSTITKPYIFSNTLFVPLKYGQGRIDQVTDARQAIYILERLKKQGRLNRTANKEEVKKFAEHISKIKNRRFFDFRLRRIYELEKVDSFLQANNLISKTDVKYFAHLNDMVVYGDNQIRFSGKRFSYALIPGFKSYISKINNSYLLNESIVSLSGGVEYLVETPINMLWQNTFEVNAHIGAGLGKQTLTDNGLKSSEDFLIPRLGIDFSDQLIYYPNTRTSLSYRVGLSSFLIANNLDTDSIFDLNGLNVLQIVPYSTFSFNYFFNPRFQLNISGGFRYELTKEFESSSNPSFLSSGSVRLGSLLFYPNPTFIRILNYNMDAKDIGHRYSFNISISYSLY